MDTSSELIHSLLPVFLVSVLGASALSLGLIEGVAEATASITKVFSGVLSDYLGRRKMLAVIGYGLAALTKPLFPLASSVSWVLTARFIDRIGKGIRGAPRDALVGDIAPAHLRGAAYGLRQALDTIGAFLGPLAAIVLMALLRDIRAVFWFAVLPAILAVVLLLFGVEEPASSRASAQTRSPIRLSQLGSFGRAYWWVVLIGSMLTLARFSEAFLVLRAQSLGLGLALVPVVLIVMNVVYALSSYPAGALADRMNRTTLLALGCAVLLGADIVLARAPTPLVALLGAGLWGLHMGLTQGLFAALVADTSPAALRGSAFGLFSLITGLLLFVASALAGFLWEHAGAPATFLTSAGFVVATIAVLSGSALRRRHS